MPRSLNADYFNSRVGYIIDGNPYGGRDSAVTYLVESCFMTVKEAISYCSHLYKDYRKVVSAYRKSGHHSFNGTGMEALIRSHTSRDPNAVREITFSQWADAWYADYSYEVPKDVHWIANFYLKPMFSFFGDIPVFEIKNSDIDGYVDFIRFERDITPTGISRHLIILNEIFSKAVEHGVIDKVPDASSLHVPAISRRMDGPPMDAYTSDDIAIMRESLPDNIIKHCILLLVGTGIRVQELLALTKDDIAPDGSWLDINKV